VCICAASSSSSGGPPSGALPPPFAPSAIATGAPATNAERLGAPVAEEAGGGGVVLLMRPPVSERKALKSAAEDERLSGVCGASRDDGDMERW
jgi:hypothetical protein